MAFSQKLQENKAGKNLGKSSLQSMICCSYFISDSCLSNLVLKGLLYEELQPPWYYTARIHYPNCYSIFLMSNRNLSCLSLNQVFPILSVQNRERQALSPLQPSFPCLQTDSTPLSGVLWAKQIICQSFQISLVFSISDHFHCSPWLLPNQSIASSKVWCPNWTNYSTWDPTTAAQRDCMRDRTDCSPICTSHYVIWLFCITTTQLVHFYSVSLKSSSAEVLP